MLVYCFHASLSSDGGHTQTTLIFKSYITTNHFVIPIYRVQIRIESNYEIRLSNKVQDSIQDLMVCKWSLYLGGIHKLR